MLDGIQLGAVKGRKCKDVAKDTRIIKNKEPSENQNNTSDSFFNCDDKISMPMQKRQYNNIYAIKISFLNIERHKAIYSKHINTIRCYTISLLSMRILIFKLR